MIPGARGCIPQTCAFRDLHKVLIEAGAARVFGLSTQDPSYQLEAARRQAFQTELTVDELRTGPSEFDGNAFDWGDRSRSYEHPQYWTV